MASKRHRRRRECESKKRYQTLEYAEYVARRTERASFSAQPMHGYACGNCGGFHVGHVSYSNGGGAPLRQGKP